MKLLRYYFRLRRSGRTPRQARNCTVTHAQATVIHFRDSEYLSNYYKKSQYTGD